MNLESLLNLPSIIRRALLLVGDTVAVLVAVWAAFVIRLGEPWPTLLQDVLWLFPLTVVIVIPTFAAVGVPCPTILRYADESLLYTIVLGVSAGLLLLMAAWVLLRQGFVLRSFWPILWLVLVALVGGGRLVLRRWLRRGIQDLCGRAPLCTVPVRPVLSWSMPCAIALRLSLWLLWMTISGYGAAWCWACTVQSPTKLSRLLTRYAAKTILLALPATSHRRRQEILDALARLPARVMDLPTLRELTSGVRRIDEFRELDVADMLGRDSVQPNDTLLRACVSGKTVLVTGAGGSIGGELCRQLLPLRPRRLVLFEYSEYALYAIEQELSAMVANMGQAPVD